MANFTAAIHAIVAERDRIFIERIAADYNLNADELKKKYIEAAESAIKVPRKYTKHVAKEVNVVSVTPKAKNCCTAQTSKKEPCKFSALKGEVFCKRHLKETETPTKEKPVAAPKAPKKAPKPDQPIHTHDLASGIVSECDLCQSHGNALEEPEEFELVVPSVKDRLAALLNVPDEDEEDYEEE